MKTIVTGRNYTDNSQPQIFNVTSEKTSNGSAGPAIEMQYVEPKTGLTDHVLVADGIVYAPSMQAGSYYPTKYRVEVRPCP